MELYLTTVAIGIGICFLIMTMFIHVLIEEINNEDENVGHIEGLIVYRR